MDKISLLLNLKSMDREFIIAFAQYVDAEPLNHFKINTTGTIDEIINSLSYVQKPILEDVLYRMEDDCEEEESESDEETIAEEDDLGGENE